MNLEREKELLDNPHLATHGEIRGLTMQNRLNTEMLQLRNQQLRVVRTEADDLIERMTACSIKLRAYKRFNDWLSMAAAVATLIAAIAVWGHM